MCSRSKLRVVLSIVAMAVMSVIVDGFARTQNANTSAARTHASRAATLDAPNTCLQWPASSDAAESLELDDDDSPDDESLPPAASPGVPRSLASLISSAPVVTWVSHELQLTLERPPRA
jgi:hypothetical protein